MPQKTNLNISPYFDDFDKDKNFYKVLFKPGYPVQARELTGLQSLLQNQVESFGKHIFKEGSMVIPGGIEYDPTYFSAKINSTHLGVDVSIYLNEIIANNDGKGTRVRGQSSGIVATIKNYILPPEEGVDDITIFIKYNQSGNDGISGAFPDGEVLILEDNVTYGNTTLNTEETVLTLVSENATATGSAFGVNKGVYFMRGTFIDVPTSLIILEPYSNTPSYRVGFEIIEEVVNANDDSSLYDNAKGFTNFAAPGADRFKISVKLTKKGLQDFEDTNFVELYRTDQGQAKKIQDSSVYSELKKYFAKRTFDESGNYAVEPFRVNTQDSLNDEIGSGGLYTENQVTEEGNTPNDDLMCVKLSPGKAYVRGYDVSLPGTTVVDVEKPRTTKTIKNASIPFSMGSLIKLNNVHGVPKISLGGDDTNVVQLRNQRVGSNISLAQGLQVGEARVYSFGLADASYSGATTPWDLHLYDIQTYTILKVTSFSGSIPVGNKVRGLSSGAIGYLAKTSGTTGSNELVLSQTTGKFISGEQILFNERTSNDLLNVSIKEILAFTINDVKSIYQSVSGFPTFNADTVLYDRVVPGFSLTDELNIVGSAASVANRSFAGVGINTNSIISYSKGNYQDPTFNEISNISNNGKILTLSATTNVVGVSTGTITETSSTFRIKVPKILNFKNSGIFSKLPRKIISNVDTSNSNLIISKQITPLTVSATGSLTINSQAAFDASSGITSVFFEPFDAEKYSIHYNNGLIETLTSDQVSVDNANNDVTFNGLSQPNATQVTVNVSMKKVGASSKSKDYTRSQQLEITRTVGISTLTSLLVPSNAYGLRVEDREISLNVPDVVKVVAVFESKTTSTPTLDALTFVSGLNLNTSVIIGEKIVGKDSRAVGQIVSSPSATEVRFVYLNGNKFTVGEVVEFKESGIEAILQGTIAGNFVDRTNNYVLEKGHKAQYCDYSKIVRRAKVGVPSKKLLIIFDQYQVASGNSGDFYSVNSYTKERYSKDIPLIDGNRATDVIDLRPRVKPFTISSENVSPFSFGAREFESTNSYVVTPNESSILGYSYYLPRIDKLVINQYEEVKLIKGEPAEEPVPPTEQGNSMEVAEISLPPYLFNTVKSPDIKLFENKRFTMRDIGALEKRIENLELTTTLSALETSAQSFQVRDADGLDRFKTGLVVNDFSSRNFIDFRPETGSRCDVDVINKELISAVDFWSINPELALNPSIDVDAADLNSNLQLLDTNCKKTGDLITLDYEEVDWLIQPQATEVENVNPFNVIVFMGGIILDPPSDNWIRTIYTNNSRSESTGATWGEQANTTKVGSVQENVVDESTIDVEDPDYDTYRRRIRLTTKTIAQTQQFRTSYTNVLQGPSHEFDYVESIKLTTETDPFMRSRNVFFNANGLRPNTKHFHYLDNGIPDLFPKLVEINMVSGTFNVFEDINIELDGVQIAFARTQKPNHKFGDASRPDVGAGLGSPSVLVEEYTVDPFDISRPAPSDTYSATSKLLNIDTISLANNEKYFGYIVKGAKIVGKSSGAVATVNSIDLFTDNWGDLLGAFFFRDANKTPKPPTLFSTGTKTFRVTAAPEGTIPVPGSTNHASDASGTFTGTGTIQTQIQSNVQVRNPPPPSATRPDEITTRTNLVYRQDVQKYKAPHRDPLAQSFTVDETGAFLTSFDVYFASKDDKAKLFVELRYVELGTPTQYLVQDYAQIAVNPNNINVSDDASVATTLSFPSPIYLEPEKEYALVFLSPSSDKFEMWVATMGQKTVGTTNLPDVENVVVSKQYIGGSLFKSQNGTIWTASQYQDLTFKLRKASFVESGTTTFYNTPIEAGNLNTQVLPDNPIRVLPRKLTVKCSGAGTDFPIGRKVSTDNGSNSATANEDLCVTGIIEERGGPIFNSASFTIVDFGAGYDFSNTSNIPLISLTGTGSGAQCAVSVDAETGGITSISNLTAGGGYKVGEVLTVDNSDVKVKRGSGFKIVVSAISATADTLFLTDVQGKQFTTTHKLVHYGPNNDTRNLSTVTVSSPQQTSSFPTSDLFTGSVFEVTQYNHAHHGQTNKVEIKDVKPDTTLVATTSELTADSTVVSVANTAPFASFGGISVNTGQALIDEEIVTYVVGTGQLTLTRGILNTKPSTHSEGSLIQTYEVAGMPLVGINTTHTVPTNTTLINSSNIDNYYLDVNVLGISTRTDNQQLCFTNEKGIGGLDVKISQNHQFSSITPQFNVITPGSGTRVNTSLRSISGTSSNGSEISFIDQGYEPIALNNASFFPTPRLVASKINEINKLPNFPKQKSLTMDVNMSSPDPNLSPVLDIKNATFILGRNKINNPVGFDNYDTDSRTNQIEDDPHGSIFVSNRINLKQPATSLKVLVGASVQPEADFRVFYRLFSADSSEVSQTYRPFPGYKNLVDVDGDGFGDDIIDLSKNDGRADAFVSPNEFDRFSEYQFSVDNLEQFDGFVIKIVMISTNESYPVRLKDFRAIALA